jgi:hypothetical protein
MENANKEDVNKVLNQMQAIKFKGVFMAAMDLLKREPLILIALFLAPLLVNGLLESYAYPPALLAVMDFGAIVSVVLVIVFGIISALIGFFGTGLLFNAASKVYDKKKVDVGTTFGFVKQYYVEAIKLAIKLFIFTGAWIMVLYIVLVAVLLPIIPAVSGILAMLMPLAALIYIVIFFKKIINASMSYAVFWAAEKPGAEASLKKSLALCEGLTWTIVGNYILMALVGVLISAVLVAILSAVLSVLGDAAGAITMAISAGIVGTFYALFQYCLKAQVEKFRAGQASHAPKA